MTTENQAFILMLISQLAFSISNVLWKKPVKILGVQSTIFIRNIFTTSAFGIWFLFSQKSVSSSPQDFLLCLVICIVSYFGLYFFNRASEQGEVSVVVPIISLNSMVSTLLAFCFLGETVSLLRSIAMVLAFMGVIVISFDFHKFSFKNHKDTIWLGFALLATFFWGISYTFFGFATRALGVEFFSFMLEGTILLLAGIQVFRSKNNLSTAFKHHSAIIWTLIIAACGIIGVYCSNMGFYLVPVSTVEFLSTIGFTFPVIVGYFYYKERITLQKWLGVTLVLLGLVVGKL